MKEADLDVVLVCQEENINPKVLDEYHQNIQLEQQILKNALSKNGLRVDIVGWDSDFDWKSTRVALIRETWDYYLRIDAFSNWLDSVKNQTRLINEAETLLWNLDKFYLHDLKTSGINIPPTIFLERGDPRTLADLRDATDWEELIIKPAVAGAARDTHRISRKKMEAYEAIFRKLVSEERMLFQQFQPDVVENGERTVVLIDGEYTHSVLKIAKKGDFRVQDDHGGTVHEYIPTQHEIEFAMNAMATVSPRPLYGRVDIITDTNGNLALQELELIEPELWFRNCPKAAEKLAEKLAENLDISG